MSLVLRDVRLRYVEATRRTMGDTASFLAVFAGEAPESEANLAQRLSGLPPRAEPLRVFACYIAGRVIFDSTHGRNVGRLTPGR